MYIRDIICFSRLGPNIALLPSRPPLSRINSNFTLADDQTCSVQYVLLTAGLLSITRDAIVLIAVVHQTSNSSSDFRFTSGISFSCGGFSSFMKPLWCVSGVDFMVPGVLCPVRCVLCYLGDLCDCRCRCRAVELSSAGKVRCLLGGTGSCCSET